MEYVGVGVKTMTLAEVAAVPLNTSTVAFKIGGGGLTNSSDPPVHCTSDRSADNPSDVGEDVDAGQQLCLRIPWIILFP